MHLPKVTRNLLWIIALVYLAQQFLGDALMPFMLWPLQAVFVGTGSDGLPVSMGFQPWQLLTYGFMHDPNGFGHLFFNGIALYQFGGRLEEVWGGRRYLSFFLVCIIGAGICQLAFMAWMPETAGPTIGASGGVYGLLMAYAMLFPRERVMLLIPPIPMSARTLVIVFGALSLLMGVTGTAGGIAHFAHLGGMLFGWLLIRYWRGQPPFTQKRQGPWGV
ncbi:MAG: rhomboid family intramembrane serine protease [Gammaproteobacteria bacterium]|jgi:membrane associated rhomboid family serine protease|nr:rhomboid family intramembrane serine protease [Xanthomonadaceae bacterium]